MNWKYCEERGGKNYWKAGGLINGCRVELSVREDDWNGVVEWKVQTGQYGTHFSNIDNTLTVNKAMDQAEVLFNKLKKQYEGKDDFE